MVTAEVRATDKAGTEQPPSVTVDLAVLRRELAHHLSQIHGAYFVPEVRLTLIARLPGNDDADLVVTADDTAEAIKALQRRDDTKEGR